MGTPNPSLNALLVCDTVIVDQATKKKSIIGAFTDIWADHFPTVHQRMAVYFSLTDAEGDYQMTLRIVNSDADSMIGEATFSIRVGDKLAISDFGIELPPVPFAKAGRYECQLYADKALLGRREFRVGKKSQKEES